MSDEFGDRLIQKVIYYKDDQKHVDESIIDIFHYHLDCDRIWTIS